MSKYYNQRLLVGNCLDTLKQLADSSIDSVVTDPPYELGFMGKSWDSTGIAFNIAVWQECMRVLKPGGHLLAFSGSRTYHRMAVAIEDAGFEIRDQIMWLYGSGFPKSMAIDKAIDKAAKVERKDEDWKNNNYGGGNGKCPTCNKWYVSGNPCKCVREEAKPITKEAKQWQGWGTALKPAHEPIVVARKPISEKTVAANVLTYGTGAINIDASRVGTEDTRSPESKTALGIMNDDSWQAQEVMAGSANGRFPANVIHDGSDEVVELFPDTGKSTGGRIGKKSMGDVTNVPAGEYEAGDPGYGDTGTAARFFYCAKTSKSERNAGLSKQNFHPTVKPLTLMRYLIKLVTPPNGTVLDPFLGSGSTAVAAVLDGFNWKGCEMTEDYLPIIKGRVEHAIAEVKKAKQKKESAPTLFEEDKDDN